MAALGKDNTFSKNLKKYRELTGLTQAAFAEKAGINLSTYINYEKGLRAPRYLKDLRNLIKTLKGCLTRPFTADLLLCDENEITLRYLKPFLNDDEKASFFKYEEIIAEDTESGICVEETKEDHNNFWVESGSSSFINNLPDSFSLDGGRTKYTYEAHRIREELISKLVDRCIEERFDKLHPQRKSLAAIVAKAEYVHELNKMVMDYLEDMPSRMEEEISKVIEIYITEKVAKHEAALEEQRRYELLCKACSIIGLEMDKLKRHLGIFPDATLSRKELQALIKLFAKIYLSDINLVEYPDFYEEYKRSIPLYEEEEASCPWNSGFYRHPEKSSKEYVVLAGIDDEYGEIYEPVCDKQLRLQATGKQKGYFLNIADNPLIDKFIAIEYGYDYNKIRDLVCKPENCSPRDYLFADIVVNDDAWLKGYREKVWLKGYREKVAIHI